jgi:hypothetical protein
MLKELLCEHSWGLVYGMSSCGMHMQKWRAGGFWAKLLNHSHRRTRMLKSGYQVMWATKFSSLVPRICGSSVWNMLHFTLFTPRILRWLPEFSKICGHIEKNVGQCLMVFQFFSVVFSTTLNDMDFFVLSVNLYFFYIQHKIKKKFLAAHLWQVSNQWVCPQGPHSLHNLWSLHIATAS